MPFDHFDSSDTDYLQEILARLLATPSPSGMTDAVVRLVCEELDNLGVTYELTRRGAIRATLRGKERLPARAVIAHLDTLGALVKGIRPNGRLEVVPIGFWSSRFAERARGLRRSRRSMARVSRWRKCGRALPFCRHWFQKSMVRTKQPVGTWRVRSGGSIRRLKGWSMSTGIWKRISPRPVLSSTRRRRRCTGLARR